jgi:hypothetical protein
LSSLIAHRVFIVGIKKEIDKKFEFPKPEFDKDNYVTCERGYR